jgi:hypothetical protein
MAKNKIKIDVIIDGKMQKVSVDAEKLGKKLDKVSDASVKADRNIKGVAGASSNASKNFSKMSQGMGGLVGAYAALAAQIFAISAAFNFLKSAGDLKVLEASQAAYAANTGLAMKVLANDIVSATNAQIAFQDASQAAAIGTAAGLSPDQLKQLGKAANDLSVTLGRDVTDSFNRLVRGVTKAEPELLDELGIILRLKDAQEDYGRLIGKSAEDLSQFEKSQAVVNKVLEEANRVAAVTPEGAVNQYNQLAKAFDDILISAKLLADQIVGPLAKVLTETPSLAIASFLLLLKGPLAAMGVNFSEIAKGARESAAEQKLAADTARAAYQKTQLTIKATTAAVREQSAAAVAAGSQSKILEQFAGGGAMTPQARATLKRALTAAETQYKTHTKITSGIFKGMDIKIVNDFQLAMKQMELAEAGKVSSTKVNTAAIVALYTGAMAKIKVASAWLLTWGTKVLSALGWIGLAVTGIQILADKFGFFERSLTEAEKAAAQTAKELENTRDRFAELNKEYKDFLATQKKLAGVGRGQDVVANLGRNLEMTSVSDFTQALKDYQTQNNALSSLKKERDNLVNQLETSARQGNVFGFLAIPASDQRLEDLEKVIEDTKAGAKLIETQLSTAAASVLGDYQGRSKAVVDFQRLIKEGLETGTFDIEAINAARLGIIELGKDIQEIKQLSLEADSVTSSWLQSMSPLSQGAKAIQAINIELANYTDMSDKLVEGEAGLNVEQQKRKDLLESNRKIIIDAESRSFRLKSANLALDIAQEISLRNSSSTYKDILKTSYAIQKTEVSIADKKSQIKDLENVRGLTKEQNDQNERTISLLKNEIYLEEQRLSTQAQQFEFLQDTLGLELQLRQIRLDTELMTQAKDYLGVLNQQVNTQKELINVEQTVAKLRMGRRERDVQRSNPFAFLREEQRVAEDTYQLELSMVEAKIEQTNSEFDIKRQMIAMEHVLLDAKLRVSEIELRKRAKATDLEKGEREALESLASATAAQRGLISQNLGAGFELLDSQQQAAIEGIIDELDKLDFARENLTDMAVITDTIVRDLHSGLSNVFSDLITNKVSSFKTAMLKAVQGIAESFAKAISDMLARNLIEGVQGFFSNKQSNPILSAAQQGSIKVASTLKDGATTVANAIRAAFAEGAAAISASGAGEGTSKEETALGAITEILGGLEKKEPKADFFENLFGALQKQDQREPVIKGEYETLTSIPSPSQRQLPITNARKLGSMFMPKNLAGVVDTQARFGPASNAQKLGSMFGKNSATLGNNQANGGMFSGLMSFMKNLFSPQNPVFKGLLGLFSSIMPLLGKILPFLGGLLKGALGIFGFANGGMVKGGFRAYANGGVVTNPTLGLVGEGRYNEAIVPLPNGKSIPVDMKGSQGQNNNITVNIDSSGATTTSGMSDQDNKQLGKAIAQAVQRELQNQKRSGGILSPYGVA